MNIALLLLIGPLAPQSVEIDASPQIARERSATGASWSTVPLPVTDRDGSDSEDLSDKAPSEHRRVSLEIQESIRLLAAGNESFFEQLELSIAGKAFAAMEGGATRMVSEDGDVDLVQVDVFHNYLDEFVRAMKQMEAGVFPNNSDYGKAANEAAKRISKPMKRSELVRGGKSIARDLGELKELANKTPGLEEVDPKQKCKTLPEFSRYVHRLVDRVDVMTDRQIGLGPLFKPAIAEAEPMRASLLKLRQAANALLEEPLSRKSPELDDFEEWLELTLEHAEVLGRNAPVWKSSAHGNLGPACVDLLNSMQRQFKSVRRKLPSSL